MSPSFSETDLLTTKLHPPPVLERWVVRSDLLQKLNAVAKQKLTLICAPAGYGKTTLLSQWMDQRDEPMGWLTLDEGDNDITQFLRYFLAAIQQIDPDVGTLIPEMLQPPRPLSGPAVWIALINDLAASKKEFILILDDYHQVNNQAVHDALAYLIEHMPGNLHVIIATRLDPPLNLAQLRARGQLLEIRAVELCFDIDEARLFFQDAMRLPLPEEDIIALVQKAEGWISGLQIAAIVLQNQSNLSHAVQTFAGSNRHILDYLATEVIQRLPESTQDFLSQTAILDYLEASLCDAITGRSDSRQILAQLDRENQFIVALDDDRHWYRYHRLMAEALRQQTEGLDRQQLAELHRRASAWHEQRGMIAAAIEHAFKASDMDHVAVLIESGAEDLLKRSQVGTLLGWLERLPEEQIHAHPRLNIAYAWALLLKGGSLRAVQEKLEAAALEAGTLVSAEEAVIRSLIATYSGDVRQGLAYSRQALDDLPADRIFLRSIVVENIGMAHVVQGDIPSAIQAFKESIALAREAGNLMFAVASLSNLGGLYLLQGHLKLAEAVYQQALELATTPYGQRLPVACRAMLGLSEVARECNNLEGARSLLEEAVQLSRQYNETGELVMLLSLARVLQAQGEGEKALELMQKAQAIAIQSTASMIDDRLVDVALARLCLQQGSITGAIEWAASRGFEGKLSSEAFVGSNSYHLPYDLREAEWLVYARLQIAQNQAEAALDTLALLLGEAEKQNRGRRLHEILVLMAIAYQESGAMDRTVDCLARSLKLAEPEGYTRVYLDEGFPMVRLLRETARRGIQKQYCNKLLSQFQPERQAHESSSDAGNAALVEPLSERELEVLHLLAEGSTNREISASLYISLSTVKGHISNINGKLLARNRTEAVARARQLGILQ
jgi:LuxR family maltose regulon positive regulatory protein